MGDIVIRDVSRSATKEWVPPIGAMGGPAAHELYRDLVQRAGLRLFRDHQGHPYVALRDGEHRRTFRVPSLELREALDRFRMSRNLRPVPEQELVEFARVVDARVSDPDIFVPTLEIGRPRPVEGPTDDRGPALAPVRGVVRTDGWEEEMRSIAQEEAEVVRPTVPPAAVVKAPSAWNEIVDPLPPAVPAPAPAPAPAPVSVPPPPLESISGGRRLSSGDEGLLQYITALRTLMGGGDWVGSTAELSRLTGDSPEKVFARLRAYRTDLADQDIVVVPVETRSGWRWLAVDGSRISTSR